MSLSGTAPRMRRMPTRLQVKRWGVGNFKSIDDATLDLRRLSILVGANSAGKSSLMQSLLLLAQCTSESQLTLNGPVVSLGEAVDVVRARQKGITLSATLTVPNVSSIEPSEVDLSLGMVVNHGELAVASLSVRDSSGVLLEAVHYTGKALKSVLNQHHGNSPDFLDSVSTTFLRVSYLRDVPRHPLIFVEMGGLVPSAIYVRKTDRQKRKSLESLLENSPHPMPMWELDNLLPRFRSSSELSPVLRRIRSELTGNNRIHLDKIIKGLTADEQAGLIEELIPTMSDWAVETLGYRSWELAAPGRLGLISMVGGDGASLSALQYLNHCALGLLDFAQSIRYLGPLRDEPRVVYPLGRGSRHLPVGSHGEYTADLLARMHSRLTRYTDPAGTALQQPLLDAVSTWVEYLGIGSRISVGDRGKLGRTIRLEMNGADRDLTTVGVGASQLLPVIVTLLAADPGTLILFEQPELHLHPAVQSRLGDFLATARPDVRLVVETHSESLINRLRLRVVEQRLDPSQIVILFGEQIQGVTQFRRLELNEFGDLNEWPKGFFDEGEQDAARLVRLLATRLPNE